jgi:hypothetical protein
LSLDELLLEPDGGFDELYLTSSFAMLRVQTWDFVWSTVSQDIWSFNEIWGSRPLWRLKIVA